MGYRMKLLPVFVTAATLVAGCASMTPPAPAAVADLAPTQGNSAKGTVTFAPKGDLMAVTARITGPTPGPHGFHIHEKGDCSAPDGTSADGRFNPQGGPRGDPSAADHHGCDLPMLEADAAGNATPTAEIGGVTFGAGAGDIVGRGVIVHKDADDCKTQPTGNSGARVACGVVRKT
jgi:Cu-Zn family superoxide dismutase